MGATSTVVDKFCLYFVPIFLGPRAYSVQYMMVLYLGDRMAKACIRLIDHVRCKDRGLRGRGSVYVR